MTIATSDFEAIRQLVHRRAGIVLEPGKEYLVESRMHPILRERSFDDFGQLVGALQGPGGRALEDQVVEAMTTNETSFFRDFHPFEALRDEVLPPLLQRNANARKLRIWCGACSSGQEPYSIGMVLKEHFASQLAGWKVQIVGTDISQQMLEKSTKAAYSELEINRGLPAKLMVKYFQRTGLQWQIKPELREMMEFRQLNLVQNWSGLGHFDVVFLRNVLIYFDADTKRRILAQLRTVLDPGSTLFLGGAETVINVADDFEICRLGRTVVYRVR